MSEKKNLTCKNIVLKVDPEIHMQLKLRVIMSGTTLQKYLLNLIEKDLCTQNIEKDLCIQNIEDTKEN